MNMKEIRTIARQRGINPGRMKKSDLIRAIQRAEGNFECYGTATNQDCDQDACLWKEDCYPESVAQA